MGLQTLICFLEFHSKFIAALCNKIKSGFDCYTFCLSRKFKVMFDTSVLLYPSSTYPAVKPSINIETFSNFVSQIILF